MSKTRTFTVPAEQLCEVAALVAEFGLTASLTEPDGDAVIIEVEYEPDQRHAVFELMELLDDEDV